MPPEVAPILACRENENHRAGEDEHNDKEESKRRGRMHLAGERQGKGDVRDDESDARYELYISHHRLTSLARRQVITRRLRKIIGDLLAGCFDGRPEVFGKVAALPAVLR